MPGTGIQAGYSKLAAALAALRNLQQGGRRVFQSRDEGEVVGARMEAKEGAGCRWSIRVESLAARQPAR